jgi:hypothetical protein
MPTADANVVGSFVVVVESSELEVNGLLVVRFRGQEFPLHTIQN